MDFIPPTVLLVLSFAIGASVAKRLRQVPHWPLVSVCILAPAVYGLGALLFLLGGEWEPGVALASIGTLSIPAAAALTLERRRLPRATVLLVGAGIWALIWFKPLRPVPWERPFSEALIMVYLGISAATCVFGLRRDASDDQRVRIAVFVVPLLAVSIAYLLLKSPSSRQPIVSTLIQSGAMVLLWILLGKEAHTDVPSSTRNLALQALLLGLGAVLLLVLAANLKLFPKEPGPLVVAALVATGLAVGYGALRPTLDLLLRRAIAPEATRLAGRLGALQDELEATRGRLRSAEHLSLVGQLAAQVAHEIKNPLGPIKGYTKIIEREVLKAGALNDVVQRGIEIIRQEVDAIDARAQGLLELARPPTPRLEDLDYVLLGQDVIDLISGDCPRGLRIGWAPDPPRPAAAPGRGDPVLLRGAVLNVARNAIQAMGEGEGRVDLSLRRGEAGRWELWVEDTGPGLPANDPELLFRPFVSHREGGNGLGLVIARGTLRAMQGDLALSQREGGGARAVFTLPRDVEVPSASERHEGAVEAPVKAEEPVEAPAARGRRQDDARADATVDAVSARANRGVVKAHEPEEPVTPSPSHRGEDRA